MPKRKDIKKILVVGAGPIIIGQACEFDYSGTQACKALKDEGYKVILINSNPATIMTDPDVADKTYIEPITLEVLEKILIKEKPDAILPTMGGQTALNLAMEAEKRGILKTGNYADIIIWDADPLEPSSMPEVIFVNGENIDLANRSTRLRDRYTKEASKLLHIEISYPYF